jgi:F0F1-type ATP synthase assembly protein I
VAGCAIGWFLDRWLHTSPILMVVLGFLGAAAGFLDVLRTLSRAEKDADRDNSNSGSGKG